MFSERISRLTGSLIREILAAAQRPDVISFAGGLPAADCLPELDFTGVPQGMAQYGTTEGEPELREQIVKQMQQIGLPCTADQVLVLSGSQQAIDLVSKLFIDPGTPVVTEGPTYLAALQAFNLFGANITAVAQEDGQLNPAHLQQALKQARPKLTYLIPSFQNPSGSCYSDSTRQALAEVIDEAGLPVMEDDPYRALAYDGEPGTPLVSRLKKAPWIYSGSFSKTMAPGCRIGFLVVSPELYPYLVKIKQSTDLHTNRPGQWFVAQQLKDSGYPAHLQRLREKYKQGRDAMQQSLLKHFADLADWEVPKGGLFFWLTLKAPQDTRELLQRALREKNVVFMPGEPFYPRPDTGIGHLRLNFSHATQDKIEEGIARLAELIRSGQ